MQYEAGELFYKFWLIVCFFPHFLFELLDGVAIEVVDEEVEVEFMEEVVVCLGIFDEVVDGLFWCEGSFYIFVDHLYGI